MVFVLAQKRSDGILPREKGKTLPNTTMVKGRSILQRKRPQFRLRFPQIAPQSGDLFDTCYTLFSYQHSFVVYQYFHISKLVLRVYHKTTVFSFLLRKIELSNVEWCSGLSLHMELKLIIFVYISGKIYLVLSTQKISKSRVNKFVYLKK